MDIERFGEIVITGGTVIIMYNIIQNYFRQKNRNRYTRHFDDRGRVYELMNEVLQTTSAKRFLILKTTNGGGKPRIDAHLYASVLYEDFQPPFHSVKHDYQRVLVDNVYINMLAEISRRGNIFTVVDSMEDGILKRIYQTEGVAASLVFYLGESNEAFFYGSIATDKAGTRGFASEAEQLKIELILNRLRETFRRAQNR